MATATDVGGAVTATAADHQAAQAAIVSSLSSQVATLWPIIDEEDLQGTLPQYRVAVSALVQRYGQASASLAAIYYEHARASAGVPGKFQPVLATPADVEKVSKAVNWATSPLWGADPEVDLAKQQVTASAERFTLNAGRQTIITAANADRKSHGWARIVEPGACDFCILLATRGAVYRTEQSSHFSAHNHCRCSAQPVFDAVYEPSAEVRRAQQLYQQVKADPTVRGPKATRNAFRTALANN